MPQRSWLFVPGDSETKLDKVPSLGADIVIVDLEDAVAPAAKPAARQQAHDFLARHRQQVTASGFGRWVRINALDTPYWRDDLVAVMPAAPQGIMVPKCAGVEQLQLVSAELYELEQRAGVQTNTTRLLPLVSETPASALAIGRYADASQPRLHGLTWGAEDLSSAIGATRKRDAEGGWTDLFRMVRAQTLLTAHARDIAAIDTLYSDFRDTEGLKRVAEGARADGFTGMLAIHPAQVPVINAAFTPSDSELAHARAVIAAFEASPGSGTVQLDGEMLDQPHLALARRMLGEDAR